jgi:outer membrane protein OmpA-like peptidoglycan-associated protein
MSTRSLPRCAAVMLAALLALTACNSGGDDAQGAHVDSTTDGDAVASADVGTGADSSNDAETGSQLDREDTDAASDLESEVTEALSDLDAETRDGDTVVTLPEQVLFGFGEHELLPEAVLVLDELVQAIDYFADAPVQVNGHTDAVGSDAANQTLSDRRAQAVLDYFTNAGVDPSRLHAQGFGETQPAVPNTHPDGSDDPDGRAENRRVEIIIQGVDLANPNS